MLERVLKTAAGKKKKKKKKRRERRRSERAKTRPDGNDLKEFRGPLFLFSFLFSDSRFRLLFLILFRLSFLSSPSCIPRPGSSCTDRSSFYPGPGTIANALRQRIRVKRKKKILTRMTHSIRIFFRRTLFSRSSLSA